MGRLRMQLPRLWLRVDQPGDVWPRQHRLKGSDVRDRCGLARRWARGYRRGGRCRSGPSRRSDRRHRRLHLGRCPLFVVSCSGGASSRRGNATAHPRVGLKLVQDLVEQRDGILDRVRALGRVRQQSRRQLRRQRPDLGSVIRSCTGSRGPSSGGRVGRRRRAKIRARWLLVAVGVHHVGCRLRNRKPEAPGALSPRGGPRAGIARSSPTRAGAPRAASWPGRGRCPRAGARRRSWPRGGRAVQERRRWMRARRCGARVAGCSSRPRAGDGTAAPRGCLR